MSTESQLSKNTESSSIKSIEQTAGAFLNEVFEQKDSSWISTAAKAGENLSQNVKDILGDFKLFSDEPSKTPKSDAPATAPDSTKAEKDWTVLIQIDAIPDKGVDNAKEKKSQQIKEIATSTVGKDIAVDVQIVVDISPDKNDGPKQFKLERYEIKNGQTVPLPDAISEGSAKDIESLEKLALARNPAKRVALIDNVHGRGNIGMHGDDDLGKDRVIDPKDLTDAIKDGLKDSGHDKLDLLDMDSCMMGQDGFLRLAAKVTDNLVASPQTEQFPAQNMGKIVSSLIANSSENGEELGKDIIKQASQGSNIGTDGEQGTKTLAYYDLTKLDSFDDNLSQFDKDLTSYIQKNPESKGSIKKALADSRIYGNEGEGKRDLKSFLEHLPNEIANDPTLGKDINNLLKAENNLVGSYYGDSKEGYSNLGGLSVYVPPSLVPEPLTGPVTEDPTFKERQSKYSLDSWNDLLQELEK